MSKRITYDRQASIFDPSEHTSVHVAIIGVGNIGSNVAIQLVRLGIRKLTIYDHDIIEPHNLSSQYYDTRHVGMSKVEALAKQIKHLAPDCEVIAINEAYKGEKLSAPILISAVDSLDIRRDILTGMEANEYEPIVIDGRAGGAQIEIHTQELKEWRSTIPAEADDDPCGARFITYASTIVGAMISNQVKRIILEQPIKPCILFHCDTYQILTP